MKLTSLTLATVALLTPTSFYGNIVVAEESPVLVQVTMSDIPKSIENFKGNIIGKMIKEFELDTLVADLPTLLGDEVPQAVTQEIGTFSASKYGQFTFYGLSSAASDDDVAKFSDAPYFQLHANLGDAAQEFFTKHKKDAKNVQIPGFDEAYKEEGSDALYGRKGNQILMANYEKHMVPVAIKPTGHDLDVHINGQGIRELISKLTSKDNKDDEKAKANVEKLLKSLERIFVPLNGYIDIKEKFVQSHFDAQTTFPFLIGVDLTVCDKLPDATYSVMTVGLDGKSLWHDMVLPVLTAVAGMEDMSVEEALAETNQQLQAIGINAKIDDIISSVKGTFVLAQTKAAPFPGFTFAIPRSAPIDQVVAAALKTMNMELAKDGGPTTIMIPDVPMPFNLLSDDKYWILSSDPQVMTELEGRKGKGWLESSLGKLAQEKNSKDTVALFVSDNKEELKVAQGSLSMVIGFLPFEPKQQQSIMRGLNNLILNTGLSYETIVQKDGHIISDGVSLIGGNTLPIMVLSAGMVGTAFIALDNAAVGEFPEIITEEDQANPKDL